MHQALRSLFSIPSDFKQIGRRPRALHTIALFEVNICRTRCRDRRKLIPGKISKPSLSASSHCRNICCQTREVGRNKVGRWAVQWKLYNAIVCHVLGRHQNFQKMCWDNPRTLLLASKHMASSINFLLGQRVTKRLREAGGCPKSQKFSRCHLRMAPKSTSNFGHFAHLAA